MYRTDFVSHLVLDFNRVFGVLVPPKTVDDQDILQLIEERKGARARRDWKRADEIREKLQRLGIILEDAAKGTRFKRV